MHDTRDKDGVGMLSPFVILGQFWEIDEQGNPSTDISHGILEWAPLENTKRLTLFYDAEDAMENMLEERGDSLSLVCLHGIALQNLGDKKMGGGRYTLEALPLRCYVTQSIVSGYDSVAREYEIRKILTGSTSANLHSVKYNEIGFSFTGLSQWLKHIPDVKLSDYGTGPKFIDPFAMDTIQDITISEVGRLRVFCGYRNYGSVPYNQSVVLDHYWQVELDIGQDYPQCLKIVRAVWDLINVAIGAVVPLQSITLLKTVGADEMPEEFSVKMPYITADPEGLHAEDILGRLWEFMGFPDIPADFWQKWMKNALNDEHFATYVARITECFRIARMPQQYELLTLIVTIEAIVKTMCNIDSSEVGFPKAELRNIVSEYTPVIFPEGILDDPKVRGEGMLSWAIANRNKKIAHLGEVDKYDLAAGIYTERVLRLLALSLLMLHYELLQADKIKQFFWDNYRSKEHLKFTPEKFVSASIYGHDC